MHKEFNLGKLVELNFVETICNILEISEDKVLFATKEQDINEHWDVSIIGNKIDVKGLKKINRSDPEPNEEYHWVELVNVKGDKGWLYGDADYFAFELTRCYIIVTKNDLQDFIKYKCKDKKLMTDKKELYHLYRREGRKDIMTLVKSIDLVNISGDIIKK